MKAKTLLTLAAVLTFLVGFACHNSNAQLPANFPAIEITTYDSEQVSPGYIFVGTWSSAPDSGSYLMILNNDGTPVDGDKYQELLKTAIDFKVQPNGLLSYAQSLAPLAIAGGWDVEHKIVDESVTNVLETVQMQNGYLAESHDFQLLPNGNVLLFGYYSSEVDLSQILSGGNPAALVSGCVIQELDSQRNAVFQWRSWDHYNFEDFSYPNPTAARISQFHLNDLNLDGDGNLIAGTPAEIRKINRQTGEVLWTLGGSANEFTIVGAGFTASDFGGHGTYRLPNGNFLEYDNSHDGLTSRAVEYSLDEYNKIATVVWSYEPPTKITGTATGNAQRLPNGNTLISWGIPRTSNVPICTEVTSAGEKVFELTFTNLSLQSYRAFRFPYPAEDQKIQFSHLEVADGNSYYFTNTGVILEVASEAGGYNEVTVTREPYAPLQPSFVTVKPPRVLPVRVQVGLIGISSMTADILFDAESFGFEHPDQLTIYHRATPGTGLFIASPTTYNPASKQVSATLSQFGEFIFGYPDVADVAYPPILGRPENFRGVQTNNIIAARKAESNAVYTVNEYLPILLSWSPRGFGRYFELQIAANEAFTDPVVHVSYRTDAWYVWSNALPNMTYHWRVRTMIDDFSTGEWSTNTFQTLAPMLHLTTPNGGEAWQRGLRYYIQWSDNIAENVVLDLYKGGAFLRTIVTNASIGSYRWQVASDLAPGNDYSLRISSAANAELLDSSDSDFNIDIPTITRISQEQTGNSALNWTGTTASVYVEFNPTLAPGQWQTLAGPFTGSSWTNTPSEGSNGFYRLRLP